MIHFPHVFNIDLLTHLLTITLVSVLQITIQNIKERRKDMILLSDELKTPQIFFNSLHVGGLAEIKKLFDIYAQEAKAEAEKAEEEAYKAALQQRQQRKLQQQQKKQPLFESTTQTPPSTPPMTPVLTPLTTASSTVSSSSTSSPSSSQGLQLLDRITTSVLQQPSPTHEPKLRVPSRHKINHYQQSIQFEYDSWVERMKAHDIFHLSHAHGQEKLSIQGITRTLLDTVSSTTKKSIRYSGLGFIPTSLHFHTKCFRGKDIIPIFQQEYPFLVQMDTDANADADMNVATDASTADGRDVTSTGSAVAGSFAGSVETRVISNSKNNKKFKTKSTTTNTNSNTAHEDSIAFGQTLLDLGILHHVRNDKTNKSKNESKSKFTTNGIYRLQPYQSTHILNKFRLWNKICIVDGNDPQPLLTLSNLTRMMNQAILTGTTGKKTSLDFSAIRESNIFQSFEENVCLLQLTNLEDLHERSRLAFFINLHNLMVKHAVILQQHQQQQHDSKKSSSSSDFYSKVTYIIGEYNFTLDEIYHGILRCNSKHPRTEKEMFSESDPRCKFKCTTTNPRVHFALLCNYLNENSNGVSGESSNGSSNNSSCNFLNMVDTYEFHQEAIIRELFIVAQRSCKSDDRISMDENKNILYLPKFTSLYLDDFISGWNGIDNDLPRAISKYLIGEKREILTEMFKKATIDTAAGGLSSIDSSSLIRPTTASSSSAFSKKKKKKIKNEYIKVMFRDNTTPSIGMTCLPLHCVNGMIKSHNTKLINGGCFPQAKAFPEDELKLLTDESNFLVAEPDLPEPIDVDCVSQSSSSLRGWYMSNNWDMMSSESSWNLDNDKLWQKTFHSKSYGINSKMRSGNGGDQNKRKFYTPSKPPRRLNERRKNTSPKIAQQSPLTTATSQTDSTTHSLPSLTNPPLPERISKELVLPEFRDEKNSDLSSFRSNLGDAFSFDDNSLCSDGPPKARRIFTKEHHQNNNEEEEGKAEKMTSTVSTKEIINIFFPPMEIVEGDEDEKSYNGSNNDDISYNSQSLSHREGFESLLSRDSSFDKLFNSSMASI